MRILELHCDYVAYKPKQKALKTVADLSDGEKKGLRLENVLVVFSSFEAGDDAAVVDQAVAAVQKNFSEVKASTILVYPYAHLSSSLAKSSAAVNLLDSFLDKVRVFCPTAQKSVFGYYKEFELKCKGHPLAELSKTFGSASSLTPSGVSLPGVQPLIALPNAKPRTAVDSNATYQKLIELLARHHAHYRLIDHPPEGRTELVSPMRGNHVSQAAKCIVIMVKLAKRESKYVLAVVPGDAKVDLTAVKALFDGTYVSFATSDIAEKLAGSVMGTVLPFSFDPEMELIVDPSLLKNDEIFFNAALLDQSVALKSKDYVAIAKPRLESIAKPLDASEAKVSAVAGKGAGLFAAPSLFADYGTANAKTSKPSHSLEAQRNTAALMLTHAVSKVLGGKCTVGFGKDAEIYVDFDCKPVNADVLKQLEGAMDALREKNAAIKVHALEKPAAFKHLDAMAGEVVQETAAEKVLLAELDGTWAFLPGPFCAKTGEVQSFVLTRFGGSYWKNNSKNKALQRIHLVAFEKPAAKATYLKLQAEAEARDHRLLGKRLDLFSIHEEGVGFIFWHPNGMTVYKELEKLLREQYEARDYLEIKTPLILNEDLWHRSGHWDHYQENMYFTQIDGVPHAIKPMNCPGSILIYKTKPRSYRELPLRLAENGIDHRHELSGVLSGLFRVRAFTQDDAHIYVTEEQIQQEVTAFIQFLDFMYSTFGFTYEIALSTRPEKAMGTVAFWQKAEGALKDALAQNGKKYQTNQGDGAFYGPKIDFRIQDALGRKWQCGTIQLDLQMPERFDLHYEGSDGKKRPVMLHRVIYGSFERFIGILIEHFAGAFPTWLAPEQVRVLPLTDNENDYAEQVAAQLKAAGVRVGTDTKSGKIEGKIRDAQLAKVPYMLVVGQKERDAGCVSVRRRDGAVKHGVRLSAFEKAVLGEIRERRLYD